MACSSPEFLRDIEARLAGDRPDVAAHVRAALDSHTQPMQLFRTLDELDALFARENLPPPPPYESMAADSRVRALSAVNCHNGQKKLVLSVLEFLGVVLADSPPPPGSADVVVYAGASGPAAAVAAAVYPGLRILLFDPAPNTVALMPPVARRVVRTAFGPGGAAAAVREALDPESPDLQVFTGEAGFFDDGVAQAIAASAKGHHRILFISDVRADASEPAIVRDMINQQRWAVLCGAAAYMFKFRAPYAWSDDVQRAYAKAARELGDLAVPELPAARDLGPAPPAAPPGRRFRYLAGRLHLQLYGRPTTAELRLIGQPRHVAGLASGQAAGQVAGHGVEYAMQDYSVPGIEDRLALFNAVYRSHAAFAMPGRLPVVRGAFPSYELAAEHAIVDLCSTSGVGGVRSSERVITHQTAMHARINALITRVVGRDMLACPIKTAAHSLGRMDDLTLRHLAWCAERIEAQRPGALPRDLLSRLREARKNKKMKMR